jgi:hypothetical protein
MLCSSQIVGTSTVFLSVLNTALISLDSGYLMCGGIPFIPLEFRGFQYCCRISFLLFLLAYFFWTYLLHFLVCIFQFMEVWRFLVRPEIKEFYSLTLGMRYINLDNSCRMLIWNSYLKLDMQFRTWYYPTY